jgi:hypothetical protein
VLAGLDGGDTDDEQLARTWVAAHDLRWSTTSPTGPAPNSRFTELLRRRRHPRTAPAGPHHRLLAHRAPGGFDTGGISNGPTEAINLLIKKIKPVEHGFRNFDNYRLRLTALHCGVELHTHRATPIRGRPPHCSLRRAGNFRPISL